MSLATRDIFREAAVPAITNRLRTAFTLIGIIVACGGLVTTTSLVATGEADLQKALDGLFAQTVQAQVAPRGSLEHEDDWLLRLDDAARRSGGNDVSMWWAQELEMSTDSTYRPAQTDSVKIFAFGGNVPPVETTGAPLEVMPNLDEERAIWLGVSTARQLDVSTGDTVTIDSQTWTIAGIITASDDSPDWLLSAVVNADVALSEFDLPENVVVDVSIAPGQAPGVTDRLPGEIAPAAPETVVVLPAPDASGLAADIDDRVVGAGIGITAASILVGVIFIAVTSYASVLDRLPELALRRALGARRRDVAIVIVSESTILGSLGGITGATAGIAITFVTAVIRGTTPVVPIWVIGAAVACGMAMGLLGGLAPAVKAIRVDPIQYLRLL